MSKENEVKKKTKVVKEEEVIKRSDLEDSNENKKILIVALILALLIGTFAYVRSMNNEKKDKNEKENIIEKVEEDVEEEAEAPESSEVIDNVPASTTNVKEEKVDIWAVLNDIAKEIEAGINVELPEVKDGDLVAKVTYQFRENEEDEYATVDEFDTTKLGQYLITYTLSYTDGKVETKEVLVEVIDTTEPIVNVKDGEHYNEDVLLEITEYSKYKVELNGSEYDEAMPITANGEYTLVVTEDKELGNSITVKFVIDKVLPVVSFVDNNDGTYKIVVDEEYPEAIIITKDGEEIALTDTISEDGKYKVTVTDKAGNVGEEELTIDTIAPVVNVVYTPEGNEITNGKVLVTIIANEELQELTGWMLSSDKLTLTKEYSANNNEVVEVKDLLGNITKVNVVVDYINCNLVYTPELTIENIIANQVKATITSVKQLTINSDWVETVDGEIYKYEKIYTTNVKELVEYTYLDEENNPVTGKLEVNILDVEIEAFVSYDVDATTQNVTAYVITKDEVTNLPEGWARDDSYMAQDFRYYKVYNENSNELVEFLTSNNTYVATIVVDSIDREEPVAEADVTYVKDNNDEKTNVVVVVSANEEIIAVEGWSLSEDKKSILKIINKPATVPTEEQNEKVTITDLKGNSIEVNYSYNWN